MIHINRYNLHIKVLILIVVLFIAVYQRLQFFEQSGKDIYAYEKAISDLISGTNPYEWTIKSYSNPDDPGNHGFAYFPGMMYLFSPFYVLHLFTGWPHFVMWKIPVLLADIGVGLLLFQLFRKKGTLPLLAVLLVWFFNPYFMLKHNYVFTDPITIFFMLLSLVYLGRDDVAAGASYALAIAMKTFPYIIFPVIVLKAKDKKAFLLAGTLVGLAISLPFLTSWHDLTTYLNGTLFVHQNRFVQGRPFLFYVSYFYNIELFQIIPFGVYTLLASFSGWLIASLAYVLKITKDKYVLALIPFLTFYLFTPVFNRTYFIWFIPIFSIAMFRMFEQKYRYLFYLSLLIFYIFASWYLLQWKDGFHIWHP